MFPFIYYGAHKKEILLHTKDVKNIIYLFYYPVIENDTFPFPLMGWD
jgi:hypothetical protein